MLLRDVQRAGGPGWQRCHLRQALPKHRHSNSFLLSVRYRVCVRTLPWPRKNLKPAPRPQNCENKTAVKEEGTETTVQPSRRCGSGPPAVDTALWVGHDTTPGTIVRVCNSHRFIYALACPVNGLRKGSLELGARPDAEDPAHTAISGRNTRSHHSELPLGLACPHVPLCTDFPLFQDTNPSK